MTRPKPWMNGPPASIMLAGIPVRREHVEWLANQVDEPAAARLNRTFSGEARVVALEVAEREQILRALDEPLAHATTGDFASSKVSLTPRQGQDHCEWAARRSSFSSRRPRRS